MDRPVGATAGQDQDHEAIPGHGAGAASGAVPKSGAKKPRRKVVRGARDGSVRSLLLAVYSRRGEIRLHPD